MAWNSFILRLISDVFRCSVPRKTSLVWRTRPRRSGFDNKSPRYTSVVIKGKSWCSKGTTSLKVKMKGCGFSKVKLCYILTSSETETIPVFLSELEGVSSRSSKDKWALWRESTSFSVTSFTPNDTWCSVATAFTLRVTDRTFDTTSLNLTLFSHKYYLKTEQCVEFSDKK